MEKSKTGPSVVSISWAPSRNPSFKMQLTKIHRYRVLIPAPLHTILFAPGYTSSPLAKKIPSAHLLMDTAKGWARKKGDR